MGYDDLTVLDLVPRPKPGGVGIPLEKKFADRDHLAVALAADIAQVDPVTVAELVQPREPAAHAVVSTVVPLQPVEPERVEAHLRAHAGKHAVKVADVKRLDPL